MKYPLNAPDDYPPKRVNDLLTVYIQQVGRVYKLPKYIENRLTTMVTNPVTPIWVVDDDPNDQLFIKAAFNSIRPDIPITIIDGGEALLDRIAQTNTLPGVVLLDLNMPRVSGLDALHTLRSNQTYDQLTVVILTTSSTATSGDRRKALALGADQFYTKPNTYLGLINLIKTITATWCE